MNPGFFPSPLSLEYKIIKKNIKHPELVFNDKSKNKDENNNMLIEENEDEIDIFDNKVNLERHKILNKFNEQTYQGPLTFSETLNIRKKLNRCSDEPSPSQIAKSSKYDELFDDKGP